MRSIIPLLESTCGPRIRFDLLIPNNLPPAKADLNQIELALLNIAVNARDAMLEGGTITLMVEQKRTKIEEVLEESPFIVITVSDWFWHGR
jgi:signal transduction histidine kinase